MAHLTTSDSDTLEKGSRDTSQTNDSLKEELEGGTRAWLTVAGSAAATFASFGWVNCIGLFQAEYERDLLKDYSSSQISWITSIEYFCMLAFAPLAGRLFDRYGARMPLLIGSVMHVFGLMMLSLSSEYYQVMLSQSICSGIGSSLVFTPAMTAPQTWFRKNRAVALGLAVSGSSLGGVMFPLMAQHLIPQVGLHWAVRSCAFVIIGLLVFANLTITSNLPPSTDSFKISDGIRPLRELNFAIFCVSCFFLYWAMTVPFNFIVTNATHYGLDPLMALYLVPVMNAASFFGRTVPNVIAEKAGRFNLMILMLIMSAIVILSLWLVGRGDGAFIAFAVVFGLSSGAGVGLGPVLIADISPISELGFRTGIILFMGAIGSLTSPPIAGAIIESSGGSYTGACIFTGVNYIAAAVGIVSVRVRLAGWSLRKRV